MIGGWRDSLARGSKKVATPRAWQRIAAFFCRSLRNRVILCAFALCLRMPPGSSEPIRPKSAQQFASARVLFTTPMPHLRIVGRQAEAWANARKSNRSVLGDMETRWREGLRGVEPQCGPVAGVSVHLASSQMDCAHLERWCAWFRAQRALLQKWGAAAVALDTVDLSCNEIGDRGLAVLVDLLVELSPKVLRLFRNRISDASPVERLLAKGCLRELHLSNNKVPVAVATQLVVAAACAVDENGASRYPIGDVEPLWLRLENNFESQPTDSFARRLLPELCKAERSQAVCFVDGRTGCNPKRCACVGGARAVHLLHVGSSCLNSRRAVQQLASQHTGH